MVENGYGKKVELKRKSGPPILIFVKETPEHMTEENLDRISMNRTRYKTLYSVRNAAEADLDPDEVEKMLPQDLVSCTKIVFFRISLSYDVLYL